ncbi:hypothetical protein AL346_20515 [Chelatococcus sp. CO-6]|nr:hypothetical protein AL346_20515 [Chelatococcus sp. CO-6]
MAPGDVVPRRRLRLALRAKDALLGRRQRADVAEVLREEAARTLDSAASGICPIASCVRAMRGPSGVMISVGLLFSSNCARAIAASLANRCFWISVACPCAKPVGVLLQAPPAPRKARDRIRSSTSGATAVTPRMASPTCCGLMPPRSAVP